VEQSPAPPTAVNLTLTGTVSDARTSTRIAGATVTIVEGTNAKKSTKTNSRGEYRFENLETGNATLSAAAAGYSDSRLDVLIDGTNTLNFALTSSRQSPK
jgi:hypothetical protein